MMRKVVWCTAALVVALALLVSYEVNRAHDARWEGGYEEPALALVNFLLRLTGYEHPVALEVQALLAEGGRRTGLSDFGETHWSYALAMEGLQEHVKALLRLEHENRLSPMGRVAAREQMIAMCAKRLLLIDAARRHATELESLRLSPVFVVGLPRSGTTFLFNILAQDPQFRPLMLYEAIMPALTAEQESGAAPDDRLAVCQEALTPFMWLNRRFRSIHASQCDGPEECIPLLASSFASYITELFFDVPDYSAWLRTQSFREVYRLHHLQLKLLHLQQEMHGRTWLLKMPFHLEQFESLLAEYPDARIVWNHRRPQRAIASLTSLLAHARMLHHSPNLTNITSAARSAEGIAWRSLVGPQSATEQRKRLGLARLADVDYDLLVDQPMDTVEQIYYELGLTLGEEARERMYAFLHANPQHRLGKHTYEHLIRPEDQLPVDEFFSPRP
jgi:Sulfotransferase family